MKMSYDVQVEELGANRRGLVTSEEGRAIVEFMKTSRANMCFEYDDEAEAKRRASAVMNCCKRLNKEGEKEVIKYAKRGNKIYVIKVTE